MFHQYADVPAGMGFRLFRSVIAEESISLARSFWTDGPPGVNHAFLASPARGLTDISVWCLVLLGRLDGAVAPDILDPPPDKANALALLCEAVQNPCRRGFHDRILALFAVFQNVHASGASRHNFWIYYCATILCKTLAAAVQHRDEELIRVLLTCLSYDHVVKWNDNDKLLYGG
jgi:hypothetical protein